MRFHAIFQKFTAPFGADLWLAFVKVRRMKGLMTK